MGTFTNICQHSPIMIYETIIEILQEDLQHTFLHVEVTLQNAQPDRG
jgi:hypothetical protein